jgi:anti-sigma B factor antagonist
VSIAGNPEPLDQGSKMEINIKEVMLVQLIGDLNDDTTPQVQEQVSPLAKRGSNILLDMTKVPYMSSTGIRMLLGLYRQVSNFQDGRIVLVGLSEELKETISRTGWLAFFSPCETVELGLVELAGNPEPLDQGSEIEINTKEVVLVQLAGDLDADTTPKIQDQVSPLAQRGSNILLDMTKVPYMSSAGIRMLLWLYRQAPSFKDRKIVLVGLSEELKETISGTGLLDFFSPCETLELGLKTLR